MEHDLSSRELSIPNIVPGYPAESTVINIIITTCVRSIDKSSLPRLVSRSTRVANISEHFIRWNLAKGQRFGKPRRLRESSRSMVTFKVIDSWLVQFRRLQRCVRWLNLAGSDSGTGAGRCSDCASLSPRWPG